VLAPVVVAAAKRDRPGHPIPRRRHRVPVAAQSEPRRVPSRGDEELDRALAADPVLARAVTLVAISFDPERDTPERMRVVRGFHAVRTDWRFVTTSGPAELEPLLTDFNQPVAKLRFADGQWSGLFRHVLKVFLLDRDNRVRNVYSAGFLNAPLVLNDVQTVLREPRGE